MKKENELPEDIINQPVSNADMIDTDKDENSPSNTYADEVAYEDGSNSETSDTKSSDSPFYVDDLMRNENPESVKAGEKVYFCS